jgi:hypothetical protein
MYLETKKREPVPSEAKYKYTNYLRFSDALIRIFSYVFSLARSIIAFIHYCFQVYRNQTF